MNYTLLHMQRKLHPLTALDIVNGFYPGRKVLDSIKFVGHKLNLHKFCIKKNGVEGRIPVFLALEE